MGYRPSFTRVSNHSPSTYMFHGLSKMKPVVKIKYLIAIPLSKHTSQLFAAIWWWECTGVMASCGCSAAEGQAGLCTWLAAVIHPTSSTCFTPGSRHAQVLTHRDWCWGWCLWRLGPSELYFKTCPLTGIKQFKSVLFSWWRKSLPQVNSNHTWAELPAASFSADYIYSIRWPEIPSQRL